MIYSDNALRRIKGYGRIGFSGFFFFAAGQGFLSFPNSRALSNLAYAICWPKRSALSLGLERGPGPKRFKAKAWHNHVISIKNIPGSR
jgi:hypothetical protein